MQEAFHAVTQYYPYTVQPWEMDRVQNIRRREYLFVTDMHGVMNSSLGN